MLENEDKITQEEEVKEEPKNEIQVADNELDEAIDEKLLSLPLNKEERNLINSIIEAPTKEELQKQFDLFNVNQSKKDALRIIKLNNLLGKVEDQAIERFTKRPDQASNKDLLEYMTVVSNQIDRAQKSINSLDMSPSIHVSNQKNEVNINVGGNLDRDSKEKVMDAIGSLLKQIKGEVVKSNDEDAIEAEIVEEPSENVNEEGFIKDPNIIEIPENELYNNMETGKEPESVSNSILNGEEDESDEILDNTEE